MSSCNRSQFRTPAGGVISVMCAAAICAALSQTAFGQAFVSATGTFTSNSGQFYDFNFGVTQAGTPITIKTLSWSGGTNAAGQVIAASGFDSVLTLFNGASTQIAQNDDANDAFSTRDSLLGPAGLNTSLISPLAIDSYRARLTNFGTSIGSGGAWSMDLTSGGSTSFNFTNIAGSGAATLSTLVIGSSNPAVPAQVVLTSASHLSAANSITFAANTNIAWSGSPTVFSPNVNLQGATLTASSFIILSNGFAPSISYNQTGGVLNANANLQVNGTTSYNQSGGTVNTQRFFFGGTPGASPVYNLSSGTLNVSEDSGFQNIGGSMQTFNLSGGVWNQTGDFGVSLNTFVSAGTSVLNISGGTLNTPYMNVLGAPGAFSKVNQTGGVVNTNSVGIRADAGTASYVLNGGTLNTNLIFLVAGGTFIFQSGYLHFLNNFSVSDDGPLGGDAFVNPLQTLAVNIFTTIPDFRALTLNGGTLSTENFNVASNGKFNFIAGTLNITGSGGYTLGGGGALSPLPDALVLNTGQTFNVNNRLLMNSVPGVSITVAGGRLNAGTLFVQAPVSLSSGAINIGTCIQSAGAISISGGAANFGSLSIQPFGPNFSVTGGTVRAGSIQLSGAMSVVGGSLGTTQVFNIDGQLYIGPAGTVNPVGSMIINGSAQLGGGIAQINSLSGISVGSTGLVSGSGVLLSPGFINVGTVRVLPGDMLRFGFGAMLNGNLIDLQGGLVSFEYGSALTNSGVISGSGGINATSGITNSATIALSGGPSDIHGTLTQNSGAKVIVTGGSVSTFYNYVTNNSGSEFRVSTGSTAVFLGPVIGTGNFTGMGLKIFEAGGSLGPVDTLVGSSIVGATTSLAAARFREASLEVNGTTRITADGTANGTSKLNALHIAGATGNWTGKLDLNDNDLIIDYTGASPLPDVIDQIKTARAGGSWAGRGITSSLANTNTHTLGYAENSVLGLSTFSGLPVDATSVLVKYTWYGDSNLDGEVNINDLYALASNFNTSGKIWTGGDFNYDGSVDVQDLTLLAMNWQAGVGSPLGSSMNAVLVSLGLPLISVPEPSGIVALCTLTWSLKRRHRRINAGNAAGR